MLHPGTELKFINNEIGFGLFAGSHIPAGTITWALDKLDRVFSPEEVRSMGEFYKDIVEMYTFRNGRGNYILCWDNGKYMNHSFKANTISTAYDFEIAVRDIGAGEQITNDYGYLNVTIPFRAAEEGTRRKNVYPDDLLKYYKSWDRKLQNIFPKIASMEQPLRVFLPDRTWEEIIEISQGKKVMRSILNNYYQSR